MTAKILIVDDSTINNILLQNFLEAQGYDVLTALNGHEAIQLLDQELVDIMLLDMMMPGLSGLDVLAILEEKGIYIPTIIISAFINPNYKAEAKKMGAIEYMDKPLNLKGLLARIEDISQHFTYTIK
jgi:two-component system cell cycle response regulator